jgi:hypothetical protein
MKRVGRPVLIALGGVGLLVVAVWLNLPSSAVWFVRGIADQRHPVAFDFGLARLPRSAAGVDVTLSYVPKTPILGISEHYWSIIAPLHIDIVTRQMHFAIADGHIRFEGPTALVGLSNFRLSSAVLDVSTGHGDALQVGLADTGDQPAPQSSTIPLSRTERGTYIFEGPLALWRLTGVRDEKTGLMYSPRAPSIMREVLSPDVRAVRVRIDFAAYPTPTFQAPADWSGDGWHRDGSNFTQAGAKLTDQELTIRRGVTLRIPFSRDCSSPPQFAAVTKSEQPAWSAWAGLWAPIASQTWQEFQRAHAVHDVRVEFVPAHTPPPDGFEAVRIQATGAGTHRLFAACPSPHYDSVAVTWIDVVVR